MIDTSKDKLTQRQRYWLNHIQKCKESGKSFRAYAKSNDINCSALYAAHRKLKQIGVIASNKAAPTFQRLTLQRDSLPSTVKITCPNGFIVEAHAEISSLQPVLQMVRAIQ